MKKTIRILIIGLLMGSAQYGFSQNGKQDAALSELLSMQDSVILSKRIDSLIKTNAEKDLALVANFYRSKQNAEKLQEISAISIEKFPNGQEAFNRAADDLYNESDGEEKLKKYHEFVSRFQGLPQFEGHRFFEYAKTYVAFGFAKSKPKEVKVWLDKINDPVYKAQAYSYGARELNSAGNNQDAESLIKYAIDRALEKQPIDSVVYLEYARIAASILIGLNKFEEGYRYAKLTHDELLKSDSKIHRGWSSSINQVYRNSLVGTRRYAEVFDQMEASIKNGNATQLIKERFKEAYLTVKGTTNGYQSYYENLVNIFKKKVYEDALAEMINVPAYQFTVTDVNNKQVKLSDYKNKVVVLDFWATWCGPCKASFPRMQLAVNAHKNDPDVVFLFIHTWETSTDPTIATKNALGYLKENKYAFNLLMDLKSPSTKSNDAAKGFGLKGIPTKLVLDKKGNIRFNVVGDSNSGDDAFLEHLGAMITLAKENS